MPELTFIETNSERIYNTVITSLEKSVGEPLYPGDERRIFGDALVAVVLAIYSKTNDKYTSLSGVALVPSGIIIFVVIAESSEKRSTVFAVADGMR